MFKESPVPAFSLALFAGALLPLAFAPFGFWPLGILALALLQWLWHHASPLRAWQLGFCFGLSFFGFGVSWVFISIHRYGNAPLPLAAFLTLAFVFILAQFIGWGGYLQRKFFSTSRPIITALTFASLWVFAELARSTVFGGFPWLLLGNSSIDSPLRHYAPLVGVYGLSYLFAFHSSLFASLGSGISSRKKHRERTIIIVLLAGSYLGALGLSHHSFTKSHGQPLSASLIQGNIKPMDKFLFADPINAVWQTYGRLSQNEWSQDLIVWPENAIPLPYDFASALIEAIKEKIQPKLHQAQSTVIIGIPKAINEKNEEHYNTLLTLGDKTEFYFKRQLVPFGEFLPLDRWLRGLVDFFDLPMSNFVSGPDIQPLIHIKHTRLAPFICYEMAYPELVRQSLGNAEMMITLSEDGWFGDSLGPHQHLEIARMRALETGLPIIRATTSGISAFIGSKGEVLSQSPQFTEAVLKGVLYPHTGKTPWTQLGLPFIISSCFLILLLAKLFLWKKDHWPYLRPLGR